MSCRKLEKRNLISGTFILSGGLWSLFRVPLCDFLSHASPPFPGRYPVLFLLLPIRCSSISRPCSLFSSFVLLASRLSPFFTLRSSAPSRHPPLFYPSHLSLPSLWQTTHCFPSHTHLPITITVTTESTLCNDINILSICRSMCYRGTARAFLLTSTPVSLSSLCLLYRSPLMP